MAKVTQKEVTRIKIVISFILKQNIEKIVKILTGYIKL